MNMFIDHIINKIIDVRMKNRIIEYTDKILKEKGKITLYPNIKIENKRKKIIIKKHKNHVTYIYINKEYKEKYEIYKIENDYISQYKNKNIKQISVFKNDKEIIKHLEEKYEETTYLRTHENNIILIEKNKDNINYYIGINDNKYENYLPNNTIFTEIEEEDYIDLISEKIEEEQLLEKYCISKKKLHLH